MTILFSDTYPTHSGESFCSSDISLDDSTNFEQLDEGGSDTLSLQNLDMQGPHPPPPSEGLLPSIVQVNPIDKLYLMQNSYFSTEQWTNGKNEKEKKNLFLVLDNRVSIMKVFTLM
jgi:hypothetical protein